MKGSRRTAYSLRNASAEIADAYQGQDSRNLYSRASQIINRKGTWLNRVKDLSSFLDDLSVNELSIKDAQDLSLLGTQLETYLTEGYLGRKDKSDSITRGKVGKIAARLKDISTRRYNYQAGLTELTINSTTNYFDNSAKSAGPTNLPAYNLPTIDLDDPSNGNNNLTVDLDDNTPINPAYSFPVSQRRRLNLRKVAAAFLLSTLGTMSVASMLSGVAPQNGNAAPKLITNYTDISQVSQSPIKFNVEPDPKLEDLNLPPRIEHSASMDANLEELLSAVRRNRVQPQTYIPNQTVVPIDDILAQLPEPARKAVHSVIETPQLTLVSYSINPTPINQNELVAMRMANHIGDNLLKNLKETNRIEEDRQKWDVESYDREMDYYEKMKRFAEKNNLGSDHLSKPTLRLRNSNGAEDRAKEAGLNDLQTHWYVSAMQIGGQIIDSHGRWPETWRPKDDTRLVKK